MSVLRPSKPHPKDPYQILGLGHDATPAQIKVAYRKLALKYHPDRQRQQHPQHPSIPSNEPLHRPQNQTLPAPQTPRQQQHKQLKPNAQPTKPTQFNSDQLQQQRKEATDKFAELSAAYGLLTDPVKKREYDHLYKFGAFDEVETERRGSAGGTRHTGNASNFAYSSYSTNAAHSSHTRPGFAARAPPPMQFTRSESCDSFFEEMIYTPQHLKQPNTNTNSANNSSANSTNQNQNQCHNTSTHNTTNPSNPNASFHPSHPKNHFNPKRAGIGFAFPPLGKHLSIHIPSRHDLILAMARGERLHNFGTRVTFSTQERTGSGGGGGCGIGGIGGMGGIGGISRNLEQIGRIMSCPGMLQDQKDRPPQKFVSTTTRIAHGQHRVVKRTAYVHCDGRKEVVVEENGVVRRRYVLEAEKENKNNENIERSGGNEAKESKESKESPEAGSSSCDGAAPPSPANSLKNNSVEENTNGDNDHRPWFFHLWTGMRERVIRPCLAPCNPVIAT